MPSNICRWPAIWSDYNKSPRAATERYENQTHKITMFAKGESPAILGINKHHKKYDAHMQVPNADFSIKAPGGNQARDGGVKGHTPRCASMAH